MKRINLGCADVQPNNWLNVDVDPQWNADVLWNPARNLMPPSWAEQYDLVVANHVLMMVPYTDLGAWLRAVRTVLRVGGVLRLILPDLVGAVQAWRDDNADWFPIPQEATVDGKLCLYVTQGGATQSVFTPAWATELCKRAGFLEASQREWGESCLPDEYEPCALDTRQSESFIVEARK